MPSLATLSLSANGPGLKVALAGVRWTITITNTGLYEAKGTHSDGFASDAPGS